MANKEEIEKVTIDELDMTDNPTDSEKLLISTSDGKTKAVSKKALFRDESSTREAADGLLQEQITTLAGESGVHEKINLSLKGAKNGVAELDSGGKVPAGQLPSYVDDVLEGYYNEADGKFYKSSSKKSETFHEIFSDGTNFYNADTTVGNEPAGSIYSTYNMGNYKLINGVFYRKNSDNKWCSVTKFLMTDPKVELSAPITDSSLLSKIEADLDVNIYGTRYREITYNFSSAYSPEKGKIYSDLWTNESYRWGGSAYVKIDSGITLGTSAASAFRGDRGWVAYQHALKRGSGTESNNNPHGLSKADIGLGNVPNVSTDNQTPKYTVAASDSELVSGEKLSVAFGKLAKIVKSVIEHLANTSNPHKVTKSQVGLGNVTNVATENQVVNNSTKNVTSGAVYTELEKKVNVDAEIATSAVNSDKVIIKHSNGIIEQITVENFLKANPDASTSKKGYVTTGAQTFGGKKTFANGVSITGDIEISGDLIKGNNKVSFDSNGNLLAGPKSAPLPYMARDTDPNLKNNDIMVWNATAKKAVAIPRPTEDGKRLVCHVQNSEVTFSWEYEPSNKNLAQVGGNNKYIKLVKQTDGQLAATAADLGETTNSEAVYMHPNGDLHVNKKDRTMFITNATFRLNEEDADGNEKDYRIACAGTNKTLSISLISKYAKHPLSDKNETPDKQYYHGLISKEGCAEVILRGNFNVAMTLDSRCDGLFTKQAFQTANILYINLYGPITGLTRYVDNEIGTIQLDERYRPYNRTLLIPAPGFSSGSNARTAFLKLVRDGDNVNGGVYKVFIHPQIDSGETLNVCVGAAIPLDQWW